MSALLIPWKPGCSNLGRAVVAIGVFDGVHLGHQHLLRAAVDDARAHGVQSVALTFDRDPDQIVSPESAVPQLLTLRDKVTFISETGVDIVLMVPFDSTLAAMGPKAFLENVLLGSLRPVIVHVGQDFRFGSGASGDVASLEGEGHEAGYEVVPHSLVQADGVPVTSTRVRRLVTGGRVEEAARLLGRPTRVTGTVHRGRGEGNTLGFPTANIVPVPFAAVPGDGVYAGCAVLAGEDAVRAAISVGTPPMFPESTDVLEAHLIGYSGDLYGREIVLEFVSRLRDQKRFESVDALQEAMRRDVEAAKHAAGTVNGAVSVSEA